MINAPLDPTKESGSAKQLLTFSLAREFYGLDLQRVREIRTFGGVTRIPNAPPSVEGVMNLRGEIVPIVNVRTRLGLPAVKRDRITVVVIVEAGPRLAGLVVDAVEDVIDVESESLTHAPSLGTDIDTTFLSCIAQVREQLVLVLDIDRLVAADEIATSFCADSIT